MGKHGWLFWIVVLLVVWWAWDNLLVPMLASASAITSVPVAGEAVLPATAPVTVPVTSAPVVAQPTPRYGLISGMLARVGL